MGGGLALATILTLGPGVAAVPCQDSRVQVTVLADTRGFLGSLSPRPATNSHGHAVFHAVRKDQREGIYAAWGGALLVIAEMHESISIDHEALVVEAVGRRPAITRETVCLFSARFEGGAGIVASRGVGGPFRMVADSTEAFREFGEQVAANGSGAVAFYATVDPPGHPDRDDAESSRRSTGSNTDPDDIAPPNRRTRDGWEKTHHAGLFLHRPRELEVVAGTERDVLDLIEVFDLNERGTVAMVAWGHVASGPGIYLVTGTVAASPLVQGPGRYRSFECVSLNDLGEVAYRAVDGAGEPVVGRVQLGGPGTVLARPGHGATDLAEGVAIAADGTVAHVGRHPDWDVLVTVGRDGTRRPLLRTGDVVGGEAVRSIELGPRAFSGRRLVVHLTLESGIEAVALVAPR